MEIKINSCPFCGSDRLSYITTYSGLERPLYVTTTIQCEHCKTETPEFTSGLATIQFWNESLPEIIKEFKMKFNVEISDDHLADIIKQRADKEPHNCIKDALTRAYQELNPSHIRRCFKCNSPRVEIENFRVYKQQEDPVDFVWIVWCRDCKEGTDYFISKQEAIKAWNKIN